MLRAALAASLCAVLIAFVGTDGSLSARESLVGEAASLLPAHAQIVESDYRSRCVDERFADRSPPCLSLRFRSSGRPGERARLLASVAVNHWQVTRRSDYNGWELRFRRGTVHGRAYVLDDAEARRCKSYRIVIANSCEDYLFVQAGREILRPLKFNPPPDSTVPQLDARLVRAKLAKVKKP